MPKRTGLTGVEPSEMTVPKMDRVSVTFALMLDSFSIEPEEYPVQSQNGLVLMCKECGDSLCDIEESDTMRVLFNTALAHTC